MYDLIRKAVEGYGLSDRVKQRVLRIADRDIGSLGLTGFDSQYRYVVGLVEGFQSRYEDRFDVSLDAPTSDDGRTLHETLEDRSVPNLDISNIDYSSGMSLYKAVSLIQPRLTEEERILVLKLMSASGNSTISLQPEDILAESFLIRERVETLVKLVEQDQRFRHPERKLVYVNLDGPYVRFGHRNYNGNPLNYFRRHHDVYGKMSRNELATFDFGFYQSLRRRIVTLEDGSVVSQLRLAIPHKKYRTFPTSKCRKKIKDPNVPKNLSRSMNFVNSVADLETALNIGRSLLQDQSLDESNIIGRVASVGNVGISDLLERSRKPKIATLRQVAGFLLRKRMGLSYLKIARKLHYGSHTTVRYAYRKIEYALSRKTS